VGIFFNVKDLKKCLQLVKNKSTADSGLKNLVSLSSFTRVLYIDNVLYPSMQPIAHLDLCETGPLNWYAVFRMKAPLDFGKMPHVAPICLPKRPVRQFWSITWNFPRIKKITLKGLSGQMKQGSRVISTGRF
jgi:hypothetical protein